MTEPYGDPDLAAVVELTSGVKITPQQAAWWMEREVPQPGGELRDQIAEALWARWAIPGMTGLQADRLAEAALSVVSPLLAATVADCDQACVDGARVQEERDEARAEVGKWHAIVLDTARLLGTSVHHNGLDRDVIFRALRDRLHSEEDDDPGPGRSPGGDDHG